MLEQCNTQYTIKKHNRETKALGPIDDFYLTSLYTFLNETKAIYYFSMIFLLIYNAIIWTNKDNCWSALVLHVYRNVMFLSSFI